MKRIYPVDHRPLYQALIVGSKRSIKTLRAYRRALLLLARFVATEGYTGVLDFTHFYEYRDGSFAPIDQNILEDFLGWVQKQYPGNVHAHNLVVAGLRYWLKRAVARGMLQDNPMPPARLIGPRINRQDVLTQEEFSRLYAVAAEGPHPERDCFMLALFIMVGPRPREMRRWVPDDLDWERSRIKVRGRVKTFEAASAVTTDLRPLWLAYEHSDLFRTRQTPHLLVNDRGRAFTKDTLPQWLQALYHRAGFRKNGGTMIFRRSMATLTYQAGISTALISQQLRQESEAHTGRYINVDFNFDDLQAAVERGMAQR